MSGDQDFLSIFMRLFGSFPDAVFIVSADGAIVDVNSAAQKLAGRGKGDLFALSVTDVFPDDLLSRSLASSTAATDEEGLTLSSTCRTKKGRELPVHIDIRSYRAKSGDYRILIVRDMSGPEAVREERDALTQQLRHSRKLELTGKLAGGIIHYYNNIFTGLIGALDMAQKESTGTLLPLLKRAKHTAGTAASYSKRLLAFTRNEQENSGPADIGLLLDDIADFTAVSFEKRIAVDIHYDRNLKTVIADMGDLHHMLLNLVVNARDAVMDRLKKQPESDKGIITLSADNSTVSDKESTRMTGARAGEFVRIRIEDNGSGMDAETRVKIFEPWFTTKSAGHGTGIGLAAVMETVQGAGGWIDLDSKPGCGTTFIIYLPAAGIGQRVSKERGDIEMPRGDETVLIVDDDDMIRMLATMTLERQGYSVLAAATAGEALTHVMESAGRLDLVILDLSLPDRPGESLLSDIRRIKMDMGIIISSGRDFTSDKESFSKLRADDYLTKPFDIGDLALSVRQVLDRKETHIEF